MKFFKALAITFLGVLTKEAWAATQLTEDVNEITINTADGYGMPTEVEIGYVSDLGTAALAQATDTLYMEWNMATSASGDAYYTGTPPGSFTATASAFTFTLTRHSTNHPPVGDYEVKLDVYLKYDNGGTVVTMDNVVYTFNVNVQGDASSSTFDSASGATTAGSFAAGATDEDTEGDGHVVSPEPPLAMTQQGGGSTAFGADVVVRLATTDADYAIWALTSDPVTAAGADDFSGTTYTWPAAALTSSVTTETGTNQFVDITLKSVPVIVFDWTTVYVRMTARYRNVSNDFGARNLRALQQGADAANNDNSYGDGQAQVEGIITFDSNNSGTFEITSIKFLTGAAATGAALALL